MKKRNSKFQDHYFITLTLFKRIETQYLYIWMYIQTSWNEDENKVDFTCRQNLYESLMYKNDWENLLYSNLYWRNMLGFVLVNNVNNHTIRISKSSRQRNGREKWNFMSIGHILYQYKHFVWFFVFFLFSSQTCPILHK